MARWYFPFIVGVLFLFIQRRAYGSHYTFSKSGKTWTENRATCQERGGDLVSIETIKEWELITEQILQLTIDEPHEWHIGLRKVGDNWQWVNGEPLTYDRWQRWEPSGDGVFTVISQDWPSPQNPGRFNDLANYHKRAYICEYPDTGVPGIAGLGVEELGIAGELAGSDEKCSGQSCYTFSKSGKTWTENQAICKGKKGDLVSIETEAEWKFINDEIQKLCIGVGKPNEWHIGLKKEGGNWKWINGKPLTIKKWQPKKPPGDATVAVMSKDEPPTMQGRFKALSDKEKRPFICERSKA